MKRVLLVTCVCITIIIATNCTEMGGAGSYDRPLAGFQEQFQLELTLNDLQANIEQLQKYLVGRRVFRLRDLPLEERVDTLETRVDAFDSSTVLTIYDLEKRVAALEEAAGIQR